MVGANLGAVPDGFGCKGGSGTRTQCSRANRLTAQAAHRIQIERTKARAALAAEDSSRRCARRATETKDQAEQEMYVDMAKGMDDIALVEADVLRLARRESHYKRLKTGASFLSQRNALHAAASRSANRVTLLSLRGYVASISRGLASQAAWRC
jgi:hypothetical protein